MENVKHLGWEVIWDSYLPSLFVANLGPVQKIQSSESVILNDCQSLSSMICWKFKGELLVTHLWYYRGQNGMSLVLILWQKYTFYA
jgi:hypothetical protein